MQRVLSCSSRTSKKKEKVKSNLVAVNPPILIHLMAADVLTLTIFPFSPCNASITFNFPRERSEQRRLLLAVARVEGVGDGGDIKGKGETCKSHTFDTFETLFELVSARLLSAPTLDGFFLCHRVHCMLLNKREELTT